MNNYNIPLLCVAIMLLSLVVIEVIKVGQDKKHHEITEESNQLLKQLNFRDSLCLYTLEHSMFLDKTQIEVDKKGYLRKKIR